MSEPIIIVEKVSKRYIIGSQPTKGDGLRHVIERIARNPISWFKAKSGQWKGKGEELWALKDVSFEVKRGEVIGIIGRNGAGKSTLLKILSRITEPTRGRIQLNGRVSCLLEVGTGFHQELTGRENIFLNGAILGMSKVEIQRKFDEIVAFSEIEKFLDTPVKRYSSGMYVRLAFAVAAHLEPDILIVDEVLAVGDFAFQKKCLGKISEVANGGRTVLFVSHNMGVVSALCKQIILLDRGSVVSIADPQTVMPLYLRKEFNLDHVENVRSANGRATLVRAETQDADGCVRTQFHTGEMVKVIIEFEVHSGPHSVINPVVEIKDEFYNSIFSTTNFNEKEWYTHDTPPGRYRAVCEIPANILNDRSYTIAVLLIEHLRDELVRVSYLRINVVDSGQFRDIYHGPVGGFVRPQCNWRVRKMT